MKYFSKFSLYITYLLNSVWYNWIWSSELRCYSKENRPYALIVVSWAGVFHCRMEKGRLEWLNARHIGVSEFKIVRISDHLLTPQLVRISQYTVYADNGYLIRVLKAQMIITLMSITSRYTVSAYTILNTILDLDLRNIKSLRTRMIHERLSSKLPLSVQ